LSSMPHAPLACCAASIHFRGRSRSGVVRAGGGLTGAEDGAAAEVIGHFACPFGRKECGSCVVTVIVGAATADGNRWCGEARVGGVGKKNEPPAIPSRPAAHKALAFSPKAKTRET